MAESRSATRGRQGKRKSFAAIIAGPHYWISVKTKSGRVVRIPVEGKSRRKVGKSKAGAAKVRPFGGTAGRDVQYRAKGQGGAAKPSIKAAGRGTEQREATASALRNARSSLRNAREWDRPPTASNPGSLVYDKGIREELKATVKTIKADPKRALSVRKALREQAAKVGYGGPHREKQRLNAMMLAAEITRKARRKAR